MTTGFWMGIVAIAAILAGGLIYTLNANNRNQQKEMDNNVAGAVKKSPILANPVLLSYVLFPILVIVAAMILFQYF